VRVDHSPVAGEIVRSSDSWYETGGAGAVAAVQLARLAGNCLFFTAIGEDQIGQKSVQQLRELGIELYSSTVADKTTKEAFVSIDRGKERAITVIGDLKPSGQDKSLPWHKLKEVDVVYFVSGDVAALNMARSARKLISTSRTLRTLKDANISVDVLVMSSDDGNEQYKTGDLKPEPKLVVITDGKNGGTTTSGDRYEAEIVPESDLKDMYGCGDSFAAGLAYAIGRNLSTKEALKLAAHCGAEAAKRNGALGLR
jgi:ribokinase